MEYFTHIRVSREVHKILLNNQKRSKAKSVDAVLKKLLGVEK